MNAKKMQITNAIMFSSMITLFHRLQELNLLHGRFYRPKTKSSLKGGLRLFLRRGNCNKKLGKERILRYGLPLQFFFVKGKTHHGEIGE